MITTEQAQCASRILPLPEDVVVRIKSSAAIGSLRDVILGLMKNSLDAEATKINITLDILRGGCVVEDNGKGIAPSEFREGGGLCKAYYTSKYPSERLAHGCYGTFLASLAALSLLTITSRHHNHRTTNTVMFHHSRLVNRQLPAPQSHISFRDHGSRVTVRDLFGNLPVRVKQRVVTRLAQDREWDELKRKIVALLLAWATPIAVKITDAEGLRSFTIPAYKNHPINLTDVPEQAERCGDNSRLRTFLHIMSSISLLSPGSLEQWVPVSASTPQLSLKGAISVRPAPSRHFQFLSIGVIPIFSDGGCNELYEFINNLFSASDFGLIGGIPDVVKKTEDRKVSMSGKKSKTSLDKRSRISGKGVDRWPMFFLNINFKGSIQDHILSENALLTGEYQLGSILEVLSAALTQWLSSNLFQPQTQSFNNRQLQHKRGGPPSKLDAQAQISENLSTSADEERISPTVCEKANSRASSFSKQKAKVDVEPGDSLQGREHSNFTLCQEGLHRKTADEIKAKFGQQLQADLEKLAEEHTVNGAASTSAGQHVSPIQARIPSTGRSRPPLDGPTKHRERHLLSTEEVVSTSPSENGMPPTDGLAESDTTFSEACLNEQPLMWTNPRTSERLHINARTAQVTLPLREPTTPKATDRRFVKRLTLGRSRSSNSEPRPPGTRIAQSMLLKQFVDGWENPVFNPTEKTIARTTTMNIFIESVADRRSYGLLHLPEGMNKKGAIPGKMKVSREELRKATVISQVDGKFILAKSGVSVTTRQKDRDKGNGTSSTLFLVDQHAADERCKVEALWVELCSPVPTPKAKYRTSLGLTSKINYSMLSKPMIFEVSVLEADMLTTYAARFADWGILFDLAESQQQSMPTATSPSVCTRLVYIRTLPTAIVERCRAEPKLVIELLRQDIWDLAQNRSKSSEASPISDTDSGSQAWMHRISTCPEGIMNLLNSRACRSAIMFNDLLTVQECTVLLRKLADCAFPFQCAHGRPSLVPLVNLGSEFDSPDFGVDLTQYIPHTSGSVGGKSSFVAAFKKWSDNNRDQT